MDGQLVASYGLRLRGRQRTLKKMGLSYMLQLVYPHGPLWHFGLMSKLY